jgi:ArsR family transcriptional regulator, arsenate/arsenite/antimonite-responsive transcriptional repressor
MNTLKSNANTNQNEVELSQLLENLANPVRLRILTLLGDGEVCVCYLFAALDLPQAQVSKQLAALRAAGLVRARREGKWMHYRAVRLTKIYAQVVADVLVIAAVQPTHVRDDERLRAMFKNPAAFPFVQDAPTPTLARTVCLSP